MNKELKKFLHFMFLGLIFSTIYYLIFSLLKIEIIFIYRIPNFLMGLYLAHLIFEEKLQLSFLFKWYDMWVGVFWDTKKRWLYILPLPCIGIILKFKTNQHG